MNALGDPAAIDREMETLQHEMRKEFALCRFWPFWSAFYDDDRFLTIPPFADHRDEYDGMAPPINCEWPYGEECPFDYPEKSRG